MISKQVGKRAKTRRQFKLSAFDFEKNLEKYSFERRKNLHQKLVMSEMNTKLAAKFQAGHGRSRKNHSILYQTRRWSRGHCRRSLFKTEEQRATAAAAPSILRYSFFQKWLTFGF